MNDLIVEAIQCKNCKDILFSRAQHDWRACSCFKNEEGNGGCYIDGGFEPAYSVGGTPNSLRLLLKGVSKKFLYIDWNYRKNEYGFYKEGKLPEDASIVKVGIDTAKEPDQSAMFMRMICNNYPNCNEGYPCSIHEPEKFKEWWNLKNKTHYGPILVHNIFNFLKHLRESNISRQKEWGNGNDLDLSWRGNELAGEVGEVCNKIKKLERERLGMVGSRATKEELSEELADVLICLDLVAMKAGIENLDKIVIKKFNKTSEENGLKTKMLISE